MKRPELLVPASSLEVLKVAVIYGADAVYIGGEAFGLRAKAKNFSKEDMCEGIRFAHDHGVKVYVTVNILAHNRDLEGVREYLQELKEIGPDALIIADPGIFMYAKEICPEIERHISTQANNTNYETYRFWYNLGAKRVVSARELSLEEIREIRAHIPDDMEIETFIHGAMCISYSGRCLLSNFMAGRDANQGACTHPCRWKYALVEEQRPGQYYPIEEDDRGTYILNSRDLCMIEHIPELIGSGLASLKIEGRMKSIFYVATIIAAYRKAIDAYYENPQGYVFKQEWMDEMKKVSHREFTTGFYFNNPTNKDQNYRTSAYTRDYSFTGLVKDYDAKTGFATVEQRNKMVLGDEIEVFGPGEDFFVQELEEMYDEEGNPISSAPHPQQILKIKMKQPVKENFMLRKKKENTENVK